MSTFDVSPYEMRRLLDISDSEVAALRAGRVEADDPKLGEVARFVRDFETTHPQRPTADLEAAHLAAMMQAARLMTEKGEPVVRPASKAHGPAEQVSGLPKSGRVEMLKAVFATRLAKMTAAFAALMLVFSGIAVAGGLPDPVQDAVANGAAYVGVDLPGGDDEAAEEAAEAEQEAADEAAEEAAEAEQEAAEEAAEAAEDAADEAAEDEADLDDQGEDADDGEDADEADADSDYEDANEADEDADQEEADEADDESDDELDESDEAEDVSEDAEEAEDSGSTWDD